MSTGNDNVDARVRQVVNNSLKTSIKCPFVSSNTINGDQGSSSDQHTEISLVVQFSQVAID